MTTLRGTQIIAGRYTAAGVETFTALDPASGAPLGPPFHEGLAEEVNHALTAAAAAETAFRTSSPATRARLLAAIADEIEELGGTLLARAATETGLPKARLEGELVRTTKQARVFGGLVEEGSWVAARIDRAVPERQPIPKPDVRAMLVGVGPVAVFGACNFPLAVSVAGTDTVAALGSGCPVMVKAHPAHPGTSEILATAITRAVERCDLPPGIFSMVQGAGHGVGLAMVGHPATRAVAFTGSLRGGRALFDAAARRPTPIPVYAEMGSLNPVFLLPGALAERAEQIAAAYVQSFTLSLGQICTSPRLVFAIDGEDLERFLSVAGGLVAATSPAAMLHPTLHSAFQEGVALIERGDDVRAVAAKAPSRTGATQQVACALYRTSGRSFARQEALRQEVFGPASLVVCCADTSELMDLARSLEGHLTASVHATAADLGDYAGLIPVLQSKAGRLVMNGFGTGIEICAAMHHGGPYPASTASQFTSIGQAAIYRFARPVAYQSFSDTALPPELQRANPLQLLRLVDGELTRASA